jgi:Domain of unknown function (DUF4385)
MPAKKHTPSYLNFDEKHYAWKKDVDYNLHPELYRVGKGEQGVLICEPYKSQITPYWRFKTPEIAEESSSTIYEIFLDYLQNNDFVGADMARKFLQMGYTRARRYANYKGGKKYDKEHDYETLGRGTGDPEKAKSASIFYKKWKEAEANEQYAQAKKQWKIKYG